MRATVSAWVSLGANLGDAAQSVRQAIADLTQHPEIAHLRASRLYRSAPHQAQGPEFVNAMVQFDTWSVGPTLNLWRIKASDQVGVAGLFEPRNNTYEIAIRGAYHF